MVEIPLWRVLAWFWMWALVAIVKSTYSPSRPSTLSSKLSRVFWAATRGSKASTEAALVWSQNFACVRPSSRPWVYFGSSTPKTLFCDVLGGLAITRELGCVDANHSSDTTCQGMRVWHLNKSMLELFVLSVYIVEQNDKYHALFMWEACPF